MSHNVHVAFGDPEQRAGIEHTAEWIDTKSVAALTADPSSVIMEGSGES